MYDLTTFPQSYRYTTNPVNYDTLWELFTDW